MIEQETFWSDAVLGSRDPQANITVEESQISRIEMGPYVKHAKLPFLLRAINGEPYVLNPIRAGEAINFTYYPSEHRTRSRRTDYDTQMTLFSDLPPILYPLLHSDDTLKPENVGDRLMEEMGIEGRRYTPAAIKYLELITKLGEETSNSNSTYAINIEHLLKRFKLEGSPKTNNFFLTGRFDEIRVAENTDTILRVSQKKQNGREPSTYDAIRLGLDNIAYQGMSGKRNGVPNPRLLLFNLVDGKSYELKIPYSSFYLELIDAIIYSDLAQQAGHVGDPDSDNIFPSAHETPASPTKKVTVFTSKSRETLTAEETFERARNCLRRIAGKLPKIQKKYRFIQLD